MSENLFSAQYGALKAHANTYRLPIIDWMTKTFGIEWRIVPVVNAYKLFRQGRIHVGDIIYDDREGVATRIWDVRSSGGGSLEVMVHPGDPGHTSESLAWSAGPKTAGISFAQVVCPHDKEHLKYFSR